MSEVVTSQFTAAELREIDTIRTFLSAYHQRVVREALRRRNDHLRGERLAEGWRIHTGEGEPSPDLGDRMRIGQIWYTRRCQVRQAANVARPSQPANANEKPKAKADLTPRRTDKHCLECGEEMIFEPICGGCALGKMGFQGRYVCMDDMTHEFYVTKPGVELANR